MPQEVGADDLGESLCSVEQRRDQLGDVHRAAPAEADHTVGAEAAGKVECGFELGKPRLALARREHLDRATLRGKRLLGPGAERADRCAGDHKHAAAAGGSHVLRAGIGDALAEAHRADVVQHQLGRTFHASLLFAHPIDATPDGQSCPNRLHRLRALHRSAGRGPPVGATTSRAAPDKLRSPGDLACIQGRRRCAADRTLRSASVLP